MSAALIEELRNGRFATWPQALDWCFRAADALAAKDAALSEMRAELERARKALEPFAKEAREHDGEPRLDWKFAPDDELISTHFCDLTYGDFRRAARAASQDEGEG